MTITVDELCTRVVENCDADEVVMILSLSSEQLVERFRDLLEEKLDHVLDYMGYGIEDIDLASSDNDTDGE